jgi:hypothetical protein
MDKAARRRWAILLSLLTITLAAIFYPLDEDTAERAVAQSVRAAGAEARPAPTLHAANGGQGDIPEPSADPFAPRGWKAPPAPVPAIPKSLAAPVIAGPVPPPAPAGPPPLPFRFAGRLNDGGQQVVYLSRGDQVFVVRNGETLDATYKVLAVEAQRMEFEYLPTGARQTLTLSAPGD